MAAIALLALGLLLLVKGADSLVESASALARRLGVPSILVGLTVVAFGTSVPELVVNIMAGLRGAEGIAFGNITGSNMANILLVLGLTAVLGPLSVKRSIVRREIPFAILAVVVLFSLAGGFGGPAHLGRGDGIVLLCFLAAFLYNIAAAARRSRSGFPGLGQEDGRWSGLRIALHLIGGLAAVFWGGRWTVDGAVFLARAAGLSDYFISATIIAIGTSLPELATGLIAARRKDLDLAVGNVVGSNILNIFAILGITAVISPLAVPSSVRTDLVLLFFVSALFLGILLFGRRHELGRGKGVIFLVLYAAYLAFLAGRG